MIANALRLQIENYAAQMPRSNPLYYLAERGRIHPAFIARYLSNVRHLVRQTPPHLRRASACALEMGDPALAAHFSTRLGEEQGHDEWAERDLQRVTAQLRDLPSLDVLPSMRRMVDFIAAVIDEDPTLYLSYILFAEYLIVLLGPQWLELLETRCGIPRASMTVIGNHAELDREHTEQSLATIDDLVGQPQKLPRMRQVLVESMLRFDDFCHELAAMEGLIDATAGEAASHVTAA